MTRLRFSLIVALAALLPSALGFIFPRTADVFAQAD